MLPRAQNSSDQNCPNLYWDSTWVLWHEPAPHCASCLYSTQGERPCSKTAYSQKSSGQQGFRVGGRINPALVQSRMAFPTQLLPAGKHLPPTLWCSVGNLPAAPGARSNDFAYWLNGCRLPTPGLKYETRDYRWMYQTEEPEAKAW